MAKSRRKKNYKLRRRVMRTVAALSMIMAIVVAAIPVENYGTMRAEEGEVAPNLSEKAEAYLFDDTGELKHPLYDNDVESGYAASEKTVQHIVDGRFINAYKIALKDNSSDSDAIIIESVFEDDIEDFDIYSKEYYEYVQMDNAYIQAVYKAFDDEQYQLQFTTSGTNYSLASVTVENGVALASVNAITISTDSPVQTVTGSTIGSNPATTRLDNSVTNNKYVQIQTNTEIPKAIETYAPQLLETHTNQIDSYNTQMKQYTDVLDELKNNTEFTAAEAAAWNNAVQSIKDLMGTNSSNVNENVDALKTFTKTFSEIRAEKKDDDENILADIVDYTICNRLKDSSNNDLSNYRLVYLTDVRGATVYVPQNSTGIKSSYDDGNGYLASGSATIRGIASNAFNISYKDGGRHPADTSGQVKSISIPETVQFIGERAFAYANYLEHVKINESRCEIIGDEAFLECTHLDSIEFTAGNSGLKTIGSRAFYNTNLSDISFPSELKTIGVGCFYLSDKINTISMVGLKNGELEIEPYAFFGCYNLENVNFTDPSTNFRIGEAAFALPASRDDEKMTQFTFPSNMDQFIYNNSSDKDNQNDYILAGRGVLQNVVMPGRLGENSKNPNVPDNMFWGCKNLQTVTFPENAYSAKYDPEKLFKSVTNTEFCVEGPPYIPNSTQPSEPRKCTWNAVPGFNIGDEPGVVPYKYTLNGREYMEIGVGEDHKDDYIASISIIDREQKTAALTNYINNKANSANDRLCVTIPQAVGGYTIIEIADGCFDSVKKNIYKVIIRDGTVQRINANAFKDCKELQWVELGDSVKFIGQEAFSGCTALENVVFSQTQTSMYGDNEALWTDPDNVITIEQDAFKTGSDYLTFHGAINPNYGPYNLAMSADGKNMLSSKTTGICYKTDAPMNLTVMRNEATGERTLIDYPHYEEIDVINKELVDEWGKDSTDYSITDKFEEKEGLSDSSDKYPDNYKSKDIVNEKDIVLQALNISLPRGIDSVDSKSFYTNDANTDNAKYLDLKYVSNKTDTVPETAIKRETGALEERNKNNLKDKPIVELYSTYEGEKAKDENTIAGLYSGYFDESVEETEPYLIWKKGYAGYFYTERNNRGNDYLTTVSLPDIIKLPDYAFDSCENLSTVSLGDKLVEIGALPFRDCKNLREVNFPNGNNTFVSPAQTMILYKNNGDVENPVYEILECFEGRGGATVGGNPAVGIYEGDLLSNITSIAQDAFSNCTYIQEVNLKGTQVSKIPTGCFEGCSTLNVVTLPDNIEEVHDRAFTNLGENVMLRLYVPNKRCTLASGAFDGKTTVMIYGKKYENEATGEESACYKSWKQVIDALVKNNPTHNREYWENKVQFVDEGNEYIETFVDKDLKTIDICKINPKSPDNDRDPKDALVAKDIPEAPEYTGLEFVTWMCRIDAKNDDGYEVLTGVKPGDLAFINIKEDRLFIPNYKFNPSKVVSCGGKHNLNVIGAEYLVRTATGEMIRNFSAPVELDCAESITLMADTKNSSGKFLCWTVTCTNDEGDFTYLLTNASGEMTGFQMPHLQNEDSVVTITAVYSDSASRCEVEVINGSGSGFYNGGDSVEVSAYSPVNPRQTFDRWTADNPRVSFVDSGSSTTTFVMPQLQTGQKVVVRASYKDFDPSEGEYELEVINGSGSGFYNVGDIVTISAYASNTENEVFDKWTTANTQTGFADATRATTTIIMPRLSEGEKITVTATYKNATASTDGMYTVTVNNGTGGGQYAAGATVTVTANAAPTGQTFTNWTTGTTGVNLANANAVTTTFVMPESNVTITANYSGDSNKTKYKVTVNYGSGSGEYEAGETVNITANAPESSSRVFSRWTTTNSGLGFANANAVSTSFVMPASDVTVTANYKVRTDDDDDDDNTSRRPGTSTSTTTVNNRPSSSTSTTTSTSTTGTVNNPTSGTSTTNNNNGNRIYITKNGISNTDVASLAVSGSTDNFIVRITESAEATAAVEQALTNTYGSLNGLAYLPMDISLYDSTGQNKITDTHGLNITVTMPIPDVLIQYGGNARVAAADNGILQQITPRFTTIDGIACISFIPPHFSPYVIYVDTNNLIAGQMLDATPATGDPIHPKWFAAIGMACVSILLFVLSDGRKRKNYKAA